MMTPLRDLAWYILNKEVWIGQSISWRGYSRRAGLWWIPVLERSWLGKPSWCFRNISAQMRAELTKFASISQFAHLWTIFKIFSNRQVGCHVECDNFESRMKNYLTAVHSMNGRIKILCIMYLLHCHLQKHFLATFCAPVIKISRPFDVWDT